MKTPANIKSIPKQLIPNPKRLFLIDGIGAMLTAFMLGIVLTAFQEYFGMPQKVLIPLALLALGFLIYSMSCYLFAGNYWRPLLKVIAFANLFYCCLTFGLVVYWYPSLTVLGLTYFGLEIIVICCLVALELKVAYQPEAFSKSNF